MEKKEMTKKEKLLFLASTVGSIAVIVLASLQALNIWPIAANLYLPIAGLVLLAQAELNREKNYSVSKICMWCAVAIFALLMINLIL